LDEVQLQQDLDSIKEYYQNHGYIDVDVQEVGRERKNGPLVITIGIKEGTLYHVNKMSFAGYKQTTEEKLRKVIKMKEGTIYSPLAMCLTRCELKRPRSVSKILVTLPKLKLIPKKPASRAAKIWWSRWRKNGPVP